MTGNNARNRSLARQLLRAPAGRNCSLNCGFAHCCPRSVAPRLPCAVRPPARTLVVPPTHRVEGCAAAAALVTECLVTVTISSYPTTGLCAAGSARPPHSTAWRLGCPLGLWPLSFVTRAYRCTILAVIRSGTQRRAAPPPSLRVRSLPRGLRLRSAPPGRLWSATALRACSLRSHSLPAPRPRAEVTAAAVHTPITGPCAAGSTRPPHFSAWRLGCPLGLWSPPSCACPDAHPPLEDDGAPSTALL